MKKCEFSPVVSASAWNTAHIVAELRMARNQWRSNSYRSNRDCGTREFPSRDVLKDVCRNLCGALFPMRLGPTDLRLESEDFYVGHTLDLALNALRSQALLELGCQRQASAAGDYNIEQDASRIVAQFAGRLPGLRHLLDTDIEAAFRGDPAARSVDEVLLCYPGVMATIYHRIAHALFGLGLPLIARIISEISHSKTGIDIHPGASIGSSFFIDHGTGVVIGETAVIGQRVRIYQAVTLGAKRFNSDADGVLEKGQPRHPVVEDDVVIYAGATILGRITIGRGSSIGGNVWLTRSVPPGSQISQANSRNDREP